MKGGGGNPTFCTPFAQKEPGAVTQLWGEPADLVRCALACRDSCEEDLLVRGAVACRDSCEEDLLVRGAVACRDSCEEDLLVRGAVACRDSCEEDLLVRGAVAWTAVGRTECPNMACSEATRFALSPRQKMARYCRYVRGPENGQVLQVR
ncbi:hypothetical protein ACOMHN_012054 [Nucella lapillus]